MCVILAGVTCFGTVLAASSLDLPRLYVAHTGKQQRMQTSSHRTVERSKLSTLYE